MVHVVVVNFWTDVGERKALRIGDGENRNRQQLSLKDHRSRSFIEYYRIEKMSQMIGIAVPFE